MQAIKKRIRLIGLFLLFLGFLGCKDDDEKPVNDSKTPQELIVQRWRVDAVTRDGQNLNTSSFRIKFNNDNSFEFTTSEIPGFPQQGNWVYQASGNIIKLNEETDLKIDGVITPTNFIFEYTYTNHKMGNVKVVFKLVSP